MPNNNRSARRAVPPPLLVRTERQPEAGPSTSLTPTTPRLPERTSTLGRILSPTWRDHASPLYDACHAAFHAQLESVAPWLSFHKHENHTGAPVRAAEAAYATALAALRAHPDAAAAAWDPTDAAAPLPFDLRARRLARDARVAWERLVWVRMQADGFDAILDGAAQRQRAEAEGLLEAVARAREEHVVFVARAVRRALRWRVLGRTVMFGVRWVNRALRRGMAGTGMTEGAP